MSRKSKRPLFQNNPSYLKFVCVVRYGSPSTETHQRCSEPS